MNDLVSEAEAKAKIERLRDRIAGGAKFEDVAKLGSEDGSAQRAVNSAGYRRAKPCPNSKPRWQRRR